MAERKSFLIRIDEDLKMVIEVLAYIAPELAGNYSRWVRVETMDSEIDSMARVQNPYFRPFGRGLSFIRFLLAEVRNRSRELPKPVVKCSVDFRGLIDANRIRCGR